MIALLDGGEIVKERGLNGPPDKRTDNTSSDDHPRVGRPVRESYLAFKYGPTTCIPTSADRWTPSANLPTIFSFLRFTSSGRST